MFRQLALYYKIFNLLHANNSEFKNYVLEFTKLKVKPDLPITLQNESFNHIFMAPLSKMFRPKSLIWKRLVVVDRSKN